MNNLTELLEAKQKYYKYFNEAESLEAVKQNANALQYVKDQTEEICLVAVKQNGQALRYVKDQTIEICLEAVKQNEYALRYVNENQIQKNKITLEEVIDVMKNLTGFLSFIQKIKQQQQ